jgi:5-methylcytosine-specific restriction endonuclease McrA
MARDPAVQNKQWRQIRKVVLVRDSYTCYRCGARATQVDHLVSRALGGTHALSNLAAICARCNQQKGDRAPAVPIPSRKW